MKGEMLAFLRDCPAGLANVDDLEVSKLVVENLFIGGEMSPSMLLERVCHSMFHDRLIAHLAELYRFHPDNDQWRFFLEAVLRHWNRWPHVRFEPRFVDEYAKVLLFHYVAKRDYRRAWDEFRKIADNGFSLPGSEDSFTVSAGFIMEYVETLYSRMCERKLVSPLIKADYARISMRTETGSVRAGWALAVSLGGCDADDGRYELTPTGGMVLKIAGYFARQRSEARRRRNSMKARRLRLVK